MADQAKVAWEGAEVIFSAPVDAANVAWEGVEVVSPFGDTARAAYEGAEVVFSAPINQANVAWQGAEVVFYDAGIRVDSISPAVVPDDGGVVITATGEVDDISLTFEVHVKKSGFDELCYSGSIDSGTVCTSDDGLTLTFIIPKLEEGTYDLEFMVTGEASGFLVSDAIVVIHRVYSTPLYSIRQDFVDPRDPGPRDVAQEDAGSSTVPDALLRAVVSALADQILEMTGNFITRCTVAYTGSGTLTVESTDRFPSVGRLACPGGLLDFTGKTNTTFTGVTGDVDVPLAGIVVDASRSESDMDKVRASFFVSICADEDLDVIGRNCGLPRPSGVDLATYRLLLQAIMLAPHQTFYALELALTALYGVGNFEVWQDPEQELATVYVKIPADSTELGGKSYFVGGESVTTGGGTTLTVLQEPSGRVYGVYADEDYDRTDTNYILKTITGSLFRGNVVTRARLDAQTPGSYFTAGDVDKPAIVIDADGVEQAWRISAYVDVDSLTFSSRSRNDGRMVNSDPDRFTSDFPSFVSWMVGKAQVVIEDGANAGTYDIATVVSALAVDLSGAAFSTDINVGWHLIPKFATGTDHTVKLDRVAVNVPLKQITVPAALAAGDYLVDYTTLRKDAQVQLDNRSAGDADPLYIYEYGNVVKQILDLILAAGVASEIIIE